MAGDGQVSEKTTPTRDPVALVWSVLALALGSGLVVFIGSALLCGAFRLTLRVSVAMTGIVILSVWFLWVVRLPGLWFAHERSEPALDVPDPIRQVVTVELIEPGARRVGYLDLPGDVASLRSLAFGVLQGRPFSEGEWTGRGGLYSRSDFRALRGQMLERGLLRWRNENAPGQGVELTYAGKAAFRRLLEETVRTPAYVRQGQGLELIAPE